MRWKLFIGCLALGASLSILAWRLECRSCERSVPVALAGAGGYLALLALALWRGPGRAAFAGAFLAFGVHAFLVARMAQTSWCWICVAAAVNSLALVALAVLCERTSLRLAGLALPGAAAALLLVPRPAASEPRLVHVAEAGEGVRVVVLERDDCEYCRELRRTLVPRLRSEFGDRVTVSFRSADDFPGVSKTPTIIVTRPRDARVIEGLPPWEMLRRAVSEALEGRP